MNGNIVTILTNFLNKFALTKFYNLRLDQLRLSRQFLSINKSPGHPDFFLLCNILSETEVG